MAGTRLPTEAPATAGWVGLVDKDVVAHDQCGPWKIGMSATDLARWVGAAMAFAAGALVVGFISLSNAYERFEAQMMEARMLASMRAEQHDAHLAILTAIARAGDSAAFALLADTIRQTSPRIIGVDLRSGERPGPGPSRPGVYVLSAPVDAGLAVVLTIQSEGLLLGISPELGVHLTTGDGVTLAGVPVERPWLRLPLRSRTQPFVISGTFRPALSSTIPVLPSLGAGMLALLLYGLVVSVVRQRRRAAAAERRAMLGEHQARLERASRINGLGEMASGIAHELTQPLTAVLSRVQAGRRLLDQGKTGEVAQALDETVVQTKRAAAILAKFRTWIRPGVEQPGRVALDVVVNSVEDLMRSELARRQCRLHQDHRSAPIWVRADEVQLQQVVFNLVRNAMDAVPLTGGHITVSTGAEGDRAMIVVSDNGSGIDPMVRDRLFEPFVTTKADGTGLGLALCQRLVERMQGQLMLGDEAETTFRVVLPRLSEEAIR